MKKLVVMAVAVIVLATGLVLGFLHSNTPYNNRLAEIAEQRRIENEHYQGELYELGLKSALYVAPPARGLAEARITTEHNKRMAQLSQDEQQLVSQ